jgi:hypothetical protein
MVSWIGICSSWKWCNASFQVYITRILERVSKSRSECHPEPNEVKEGVVNGEHLLMTNRQGVKLSRCYNFAKQLKPLAGSTA